MTDEQERVLTNAVERLTVLVQEIALRSTLTLGVAEVDRILHEAGQLNRQLCVAFAYLRAEPEE